MGLRDWFRRPPDMEPEDWKRIGRLEAEVESLQLKWSMYKDQLQRLVQRLEKRDQRAAERGEELPPCADVTSERVHNRRNRPWRIERQA